MTSHFPHYVLMMIVVVILYFPMCWLMASISGWRRLASSYHNDGPFDPADWMVSRAYIRGALPFHSKFKLRVGADRQYLYLRTWPFSFPGHPELRVPWPEVSIAEAKVGFWRRCTVRFRECSGVSIQLNAATVERAVNQAGGQWKDGQPQFPT